MNTEHMFDDCNTESEIMRRLFETSNNTELSRPELISLANKRREQIKSNSSNTKMSPVKIVVPEPVSSNTEFMATHLELSDNFQTSGVFKFTDNGFAF